MHAGKSLVDPAHAQQRCGAAGFRDQVPRPGMVKNEPTALAAGPETASNGSRKPEASAFGSQLTKSNAFLESRVVLSVLLIVKLRRDQYFGGNLLALEVVDNHLDRRLSNAVGEL